MGETNPMGSRGTARLHEEMTEWCRGRWWVFRVVLLLWFAYLLIRLIANPAYSPIFHALDLGIHELGHVIWSPLGEFMGFVGGSMTQCLVPLASIYMFYRQRDFFAMAFCLGWFGVNLFDVSVYIADARALALPLVSPFGGDPMHDLALFAGPARRSSMGPRARHPAAGRRHVKHGLVSRRGRVSGHAHDALAAAPYARGCLRGRSRPQPQEVAEMTGLGLDDEPRGKVDPVQEKGSILSFDEFIGGLFGPAPGTVIVDNEDAAARKTRVEMLKFMPGGFVQVRVESEQGNGLRRLVGHGVLNTSDDVMQFV